MTRALEIVSKMLANDEFSKWLNINLIEVKPGYCKLSVVINKLMLNGFKIAHDISSYSFTALAKASKPMLNDNSALLTLTYLGAIQTIPNYNVMGLAKASLEANTRFLAASMGADNVRVNAISAGPIKTLAASGVKNFRKMLSQHSSRAPLGRTVTTEEVGNAAAFLCSDYASGITGEITYVDAGFNTAAMPLTEIVDS